MKLSGHFTYRKLLKFTLPSVFMLIVTSVYVVIDGLFVSNWVGKGPFAALNFIFPFVQMLGGVGFMFGTGGSALIGKTLGEKNSQKANDIFSQLVGVSAAVSVVLTAGGMLLVRTVASALGAEGSLLEDSVLYGTIYMLGLPGYIFQMEFQCLCSTAGKPKLGLYATVASGIANIGLDALFIGPFGWGLAGAAAATAISQILGGLIPIIYFIRPNSSLLRISRAPFDGKSMKRICTNGFSELLNNISMAIVSMLYNTQLLRYIGQDGVAAYGVLMYVNLIFIGIYIGYTVGAAPLISYQYGAQNHRELHSLKQKSLVILGITALGMFLSGEILARPLSRMFAAYDRDLLNLTTRAFAIYSFSFLFSGFGIMGASFFTALNNGFISALQFFLRTMVFQVVTVLLFPLFLGVDGIWLSIVAAEFLAAAVAFLLLAIFKTKYKY